MIPSDQQLLVLNCGSSSIRFALYSADTYLKPILNGQIARIGMTVPNLSFSNPITGQHENLAIDAKDQAEAGKVLFEWLEQRGFSTTLRAVGHRIVHGMMHTNPELVTDDLLKHLLQISHCDPEHLPGEIGLIIAIRARYPDLTQVACFDTAFHADLPRVAKLLSIPRRYELKGIHRYGFHGLSYAYQMQELERLGDPAAHDGRVILAHLGNGASLAAVRNGRSIDTSMGFTPSAGVVMGTRAGDLDPGLVGYLARSEGMSAIAFSHMATHESGLQGISQTSSDMQDLLAIEMTDERAAEAVAIFCYQVKKCIGSFAAVLGGVETLVFAGGIGEYAPIVRTRICTGLEFLGIELDEARNRQGAGIISSSASRVLVRIVHTDEQQMIAQAVQRCCPVGTVSHLKPN